MSYFTELRIKHIDHKFILIPLALLIVLSPVVIYFFELLTYLIFLQVYSLIFILITIIHAQRSILEEIRYKDGRDQAMMNIHRIVNPRFPIPSLTGWAAFPGLIELILSEVKRNKPNHIFEIGSGSSTIITSYLLEELGNGHITSLDHSEHYVGKTRDDLKLHELEQYADLHYAPLTSVSINNESYSWYDLSAINFSELPKIDLLVVDGPPEKTQKHARYPALPLLIDHLSENAVVILDDAARSEEQEIVNRWLKEFPGFTHQYIYTEKGLSILRRA